MKKRLWKCVIGTVAFLVIVPVVYLALFFRTGIYDQAGSNVLGEMRAFTVYLPASYGEEPGHRYPVVYSLDGEKTRHGSLMATNARMLAAFTDAQEIILVAVHTHGQRGRDYAPDRGADAFTQFIGSELRHYIDAHFRTSGWNAVSGHSYGGLYALYAFTDHPGLFDAHFAYVPSVFHYTPLIESMTERLADADAPQAFLFLASGTESQRKFWEGFDGIVEGLRENPNPNVTWEVVHFPLPHPLSMIPGQIAAIASRKGNE